MGIDFLKVINLLLPKSTTFSLTIDRTFRKFFYGLSQMPEILHDHIASIIEDIFPRLTDKLADHSTELGATVELERPALEAEYSATGGQSPGYLQTILQNVGFNVYVHEWWEPDSRPPVARNPFDYIGDYDVLINDMSTIERRYTFQCNDGTQCPPEGDTSICCDMYDGYLFRQKEYPMPDIEAEYPKYFYIGGQSFPDPAYVALFDYQELCRLVYKIKPLRLRCVLMIVKDVDTIQDSWEETDLLYDSITELDEIIDLGAA